jgi:hypothetical protein
VYTNYDIKKGSKEALVEGPAETHARSEVADEVAARLAALEAADPSQARPMPRRNVSGRVDFMNL